VWTLQPESRALLNLLLSHYRHDCDDDGGNHEINLYLAIAILSWPRSQRAATGFGLLAVTGATP
jgi:hypothetical protein